MIEFVDHCEVKLMDYLASDDDVAMAAWVSFDEDSEERLENKDQVQRLIKFLYKNKHMSPFEHGIFKFRVDVPLFVAREWHRHRTQSYNEVSGRYTEMKPRFYLPPRDRPLIQEGRPGDYHFVPGSDDQYALLRQKIIKGTEYDWNDYQELLNAGIAKEMARIRLPLNLMTQFYATMNPRNLMAFLTLRNDSHALHEIRMSAVQAEKFLADAMPFTYDAYVNVRNEENDARAKTNVNVTINNPAYAADIARAVDNARRAFGPRARNV